MYTATQHTTPQPSTRGPPPGHLLTTCCDHPLMLVSARCWNEAARWHARGHQQIKHAIPPYNHSLLRDKVLCQGAPRSVRLQNPCCPKNSCCPVGLGQQIRQLLCSSSTALLELQYCWYQWQELPGGAEHQTNSGAAGIIICNTNGVPCRVSSGIEE
jgi:hypothetical protein